MSHQFPTGELFIAADRTYTIPGFIACSGVSYSKIRLADRAGCPCPSYSIGKRKFIDGADAIQYLHKLRDLNAAK